MMCHAGCRLWSPLQTLPQLGPSATGTHELDRKRGSQGFGSPGFFFSLLLLAVLRRRPQVHGTGCGSELGGLCLPSCMYMCMLHQPDSTNQQPPPPIHAVTRHLEFFQRFSAPTQMAMRFSFSLPGAPCYAGLVSSQLFPGLSSPARTWPFPMNALPAPDFDAQHGPRMPPCPLCAREPRCIDMYP